MRLRSQRVLLLLAATTVACTAPSAPSFVTAEFVLTDVDGRTLPTGSPPGTGTPGPTIVSGYMAMDQGGGALISEDRIDPAGTRYNLTTPYTYTIKGTHIQFAFVGSCFIAICPTPPTGEILDNGIHVHVVFSPAYTFHVYNFRTVPRT